MQKNCCLHWKDDWVLSKRSSVLMCLRMNNMKNGLRNSTAPFGWKGALTITSVLQTLSKPFLALRVVFLSVCLSPSVFWIYRFSASGFMWEEQEETAASVRMPLTEIWSWHWSCFMFWQLPLFLELISIFMRDTAADEVGWWRANTWCFTLPLLPCCMCLLRRDDLGPTADSVAEQRWASLCRRLPS